MAIATGRTRTLTFSGAIVMGCNDYQWGSAGTGAPPGITQTESATATYLDIQNNGFEIQLSYYCKSGGDVTIEPLPVIYTRSLTVLYNGSVIYTNSVTTTVSPGMGTPFPWSVSEDGSGSWSISFTAAEYFSQYIPSASTLVNGSYFPSMGGTAQGDGLSSRGAQFYEVISGEISFSVSSGSDLAYSTTFTPPSGTVVGYPIYAYAKVWSPSDEEGQAMPLTCSTSFLLNSTGFGCAYTFAPSRGGSPGGLVDCTAGCLRRLRWTQGLDF